MCARKFKISSKYSCLIFAVLLSSCTPFGFVKDPTPTPIQDPSLIDPTLITGEPCLPPCWHGIEVGVTGKEEVIQTISALSFIDFNSKREGDSSIQFPPGYEDIKVELLVFDCKTPENKRCINMMFVDDRLVRLELFPNYTINLYDISELLGEPDLLGMHPQGRGGGIICNGFVVWSEQRLEIEFSETREIDGRDLCRIISQNNDKLPKDVRAVFISIIPEEEVITPRSWYFSWRGFIDP